jgi:hypothetical protein
MIIRFHKLLIAIAMLTFVVLNAGCLYPSDRDELLGTYVAEYEFGTDKLELKSDGPFTQEVTLKEEGNVIHGDGRWKYDKGKRYIHFEDIYVLSVVTAINAMTIRIFLGG